MGTHNAGVNHRVFVVGVIREGLEHPEPDTRFTPSPKAGMDFAIVTKECGEVAPGNPGTIPIQYCFDEQAIVASGRANTPDPTGQQVFDAFPLVIAKGIAARHRSTPGHYTTWKVNHEESSRYGL
jgi:hypothetical protein